MKSLRCLKLNKCELNYKANAQEIVLLILANKSNGFDVKEAVFITFLYIALHFDLPVCQLQVIAISSHVMNHNYIRISYNRVP